MAARTLGAMRQRALAVLIAIAAGSAGVAANPARPPQEPDRLWVDAERGRDQNPGTHARPLRTLSAALARLTEPLAESVKIELSGDSHPTTGGHGMPHDVLELMLRMRPGVEVRIVGQRAADGALPVLAWEGGRAMVDVRDGHWRLENLQVGSFSQRQRTGVMVEGPALVTLADVTIRTRSHSDAGILAHRLGRVVLLGAIRLNEHLHDETEDDSFCGIIATDHGTVKFDQREGASLELGNGSLSASYYGVIRLGCATAKITSHGRQSNNLAVNQSGRIDLHGTTTTLRARVRKNTPIGPEHDGHILAEDAHIVIEGENDCAITLQKASTFTCNDIELRGTFRKTLWVMSGSMFVGRFLGDVTLVEAHTGGAVHLEAVAGQVLGPVIATSGGTISLPDGTVVRGPSTDRGK
jgi:hypothetical protein